MAFNESEQARIKSLLGTYIETKRPPAHLRDRVDLSFRLDDQSVEIFEIRPTLRDLSIKIEEPVAKATYLKRAEAWRIYWQRADLKWHRYEPVPELSSIEEFIFLVEKDAYGCFWG